MRAMTLLGNAAGNVTAAIDGLLLASPKPGSTEVANFLRVYPSNERNAVAQALIARGVSPNTVASALTWLNNEARWNMDVIKNVLTVVAAGGAAFHGYRRNRGSIGWGIAWFLSGLVFPVITTGIAFAMGYGKAKS